VTGTSPQARPVRDSTDPDGPVLLCPRAGMAAFLADVKPGGSTWRNRHLGLACGQQPPAVPPVRR
jgi:hypothetical protein